jgi:hypothetical protein
VTPPVPQPGFTLRYIIEGPIEYVRVDLIYKNESGQDTDEGPGGKERNAGLIYPMDFFRTKRPSVTIDATV